MTPRCARGALAVVLAAVGLCGLAGPARAQISPGPLTRAHAKLEGSTHCLDCHDPAEGVAPRKCLACHGPLAKRITAGEGLHARADYRDCRRCHVEHQGQDFELVYWGKAGRAAFDHRLTGHALAGKHAQLGCGECHKTRSFLGALSECSACHRDEHRGQFRGRGCASCHGEQAWKPAAGFDHAKTSWPLTGRHVSVGCERCHTSLRRDPQNAAARYRLFKQVGGRECASCHEDVHKARLGANCAACHATAGWKQTRTTAFDHDKTAYPLAGRHRGLACDACHKPGRPLRVKHDRCDDCHADAHAERPVRRVKVVSASSGGAAGCDACHTVEGFRPARYGLEEHAKTAYPLRGAHLAVACDECHRRQPGAGALRSAALAGSSARVTLKLDARRCSDCHRDPHHGEASVVPAADGCATCHRVESWRAPGGFDHAKTRYPLAGRHARLSCSACHARAHDGAPARLAFKSTPLECSGCHRDPHDGQFAARGTTACERCHATDSLEAKRFVHNRDSRYALDGAHARVACPACHKPERRGVALVVRYKPLPVNCAGCHDGARQTAARGESR